MATVKKSKTSIFPTSDDDKLVVMFEKMDAAWNASLREMNWCVPANKKNIMNNILQIENPAFGFYKLYVVNFEKGKQRIEKIIIKDR